jgi:hypothetical protein
MTRNIPGHVHSFEVTKTSAQAVTFHLRPSPLARDGCAYHAGGWALATVNNETGEFAIQSDWGNWAYRWNVHHLGDNTSLIKFIADRDAGHCDYIANKLAPRSEAYEFDAEETVREMRQRLCERRLEAGRAIIENFDEEESDAPRPRIYDYRPAWIDSVEVRSGWDRSVKWPFDGPTVRGVYDRLETLLSIDDGRAFVEAFFEIEGYQMVTQEPWEMTRTSPSSAYQQLLHGILPAVVEACRKHVSA